jgi:hypothetical protein
MPIRRFSPILPRSRLGEAWEAVVVDAFVFDAAPFRAVDEFDDVEIFVLGIEPGVEHGHVGIDP